MREMTQIKHDTTHPDLRDVKDLVAYLAGAADEEGALQVDASVVRFVGAKKLIDFVGHISSAIVPWAVVEWLRGWSEPGNIYHVGPMTFLVVPRLDGEPSDVQVVHDFINAAVDRFYINRAGYQPGSALGVGELEIDAVSIAFEAVHEKADEPGVRFLRWRARQFPDRSAEEPAWPSKIKIGEEPGPED